MKMKKINTLIGIFSLIVLLAGCASTSPTITHPTPSFPTPNGNQGLVYFYRVKAFAGSAISYDIHLGDEVIGAIKNGTYFYQIFDPGKYQFWAKTEARKDIFLDVKPGKTYYIKCEIGMGILVGRPKFTIVADITGKNEILNCEYTTIKR